VENPLKSKIWRLRVSFLLFPLPCPLAWPGLSGLRPSSFSLPSPLQLTLLPSLPWVPALLIFPGLVNFGKKLRQTFYVGAKAAVLMYSVKSEETFRNALEFWFREIFQTTPEATFIFVGFSEGYVEATRKGGKRGRGR
jgi:hypothetical protein